MAYAFSIASVLVDLIEYQVGIGHIALVELEVLFDVLGTDTGKLGDGESFGCECFHVVYLLIMLI